MTAPQPATPGSDGEVCCETDGSPRCDDCPLASRPAAPSEPPAEWVRAVDANRVLAEERAAHTRTMDRLAAVLSSVGEGPRNAATEPPAEAQQDDERVTRGVARALWTQRLAHDPSVRERTAFLAGWDAALAARPSADTETLRARIGDLLIDHMPTETARGYVCDCNDQGSQNWREHVAGLIAALGPR